MSTKLFTAILFTAISQDYQTTVTVPIPGSYVYNSSPCLDYQYYGQWFNCAEFFATEKVMILVDIGPLFVMHGAE